MTDESTTNSRPITTDATNDAKTTAGGVDAAASGASTTMPPTPPIGSDAVGSGEATAAAGAGPAGPGEEHDTSGREPVDSVGATSGSPVTKIADAATDAAKQAGAKLKDAAQSADLDELADQAKRVTGEWTERIRQEYRRRPGVVIGAAVGAVVLLGVIARGLGRRR